MEKSHEPTESAKEMEDMIEGQEGNQVECLKALRKVSRLVHEGFSDRETAQSNEERDETKQAISTLRSRVSKEGWRRLLSTAPERPSDLSFLHSPFNLIRFLNLCQCLSHLTQSF